MVRMDWQPSQDGLSQILQMLKVEFHHLKFLCFNFNFLDSELSESRHSNTEECTAPAGADEPVRRLQQLSHLRPDQDDRGGRGHQVIVRAHPQEQREGALHQVPAERGCIHQVGVFVCCG